MNNLESTVQIIDRHHVFIKKGATTTIVVLSGNIVVVCDAHVTIKDVPFIKLVKTADTPEDAYQEYLHVLGKMVLKHRQSKYFDCPHFEEHLFNGSHEYPLSAVGIAREAVGKYNEWEQVASKPCVYL